jgi:hypothetical protein
MFGSISIAGPFPYGPIVCAGPGGGLVSLIVNSDGTFEVVVLELPADQDIPHDLLFVIALAMKLDHQGILLCNQKI